MNEKEEKQVKQGRRYSKSADEKNTDRKRRYSDNTDKKKKKKRYLFFKILAVILIIIFIFFIIAYSFLQSKLSKMNIVDLDKNAIDINNELYDELSGVINEKDFKDVINILFLGSDSKTGKTYEGTSDAIMIISLNPKKKTVKLISIPRDTSVEYLDSELPKGASKKYKINHAFPWGKEELSLKIINRTFGLNLSEFITININQMYEIINNIGGVELNISKTEMNYINENQKIFYEMSGNKEQKLTKSGKVTVTGEQAVTYTKDRASGTGGDFTRTERQREVFQAIIDKILKKDIGEINKNVDMILGMLTTNIDFNKYMGLMTNLIINNKDYEIIPAMVPDRAYSTDGSTKDGSYLYVTNVEKASKDFKKYMYEM